MKMVKKISQDAESFRAIYECQACGQQAGITGYNTDEFHQKVIPEWKCPECGESNKSLGIGPNSRNKRIRDQKV